MKNLNAEAKRIYNLLLDYDPGERLDALERLCGDDPKLRQMVDELFQTPGEPTGYSDGPMTQHPLATTYGGEIRSTAFDSGASTEPPEEKGYDAEPVARFKILQHHASGGLGDVFQALDQELNRKVALKEIRPEVAGNERLRSRFELEAEVTGHLEHPGIVPVYGAGRHKDGRPYYAMRFVHGETLESAIVKFHDASKPTKSKERTLRFRQLLASFVSVCKAIGFAHDAGVIHRDLKPSNVMLGKFGETLVVDWGLAKPIEAADDHESEHEVFVATSDDLAPTMDGMVIGTVGFMSPEQAKGAQSAVGAAADIYSLGAMLYFLLAGQTPIKGSFTEIIDKTKKGEFVAPRHVRRDVHPALEAICLKAMSLDPSDRYANALDLASEVESWLADERVTAFHEPLLNRMSRWSRKHQGLVASLVTFGFLTILAFAVIAIVSQQTQLNRQVKIERAQREITAALDRTDELTANLTKQVTDPKLSMNIIAHPAEGMQRAANARNEWEQASLIVRNADVPIDEGVLERVDECDEQLHEIEQFVALANQVEQNRLNLIELGADGVLRVVEVCSNYAKLFEETLGVDLRRDEPSIIAERVVASPYRTILVAALDHWVIASQLSESEDRDLLPILFEVARLADPDPLRDEFRQLSNWSNRKKLEEIDDKIDVSDQTPQFLELLAFKLYPERRIKLLRRALLEYPDDFWLLFAIARLGDEPSERIGYIQAALCVRPDTLAIWNNLGTAFDQMGESDEAIKAFEHAIELGPDRANLTHFNLGYIYNRRNRWPKAVGHLRKAVGLMPDNVDARHKLGVALFMLQQSDAALEQFQEVLKRDPGYDKAYLGLGEVYLQQGRFQEAVDAFNRAIALMQESDPRRNSIREYAAKSKGYLRLAQEQIDELKLEEGKAEVQAVLNDPNDVEVSNPNPDALRKAYWIELEAGKHYMVSLDGDFSGCVKIQDEDQFVQRFNGIYQTSDSTVFRIAYSPDASDRYKVVVAGTQPGQSGQFKLTIEEVKEPSTTMLSVECEEGDQQDVFSIFGEVRVSLEAGTHYSIELTDADSACFLDVIDPNNKSFMQPTSVGPRRLGMQCLELTATRSGEYVFQIGDVSESDDGSLQVEIREYVMAFDD